MSRISRRKLLVAGGSGAALLAATGTVANALFDDSKHGTAPNGLTGVAVAGANPVHAGKVVKVLSFAGTDGWVAMPEASAPLAPWWPDPWADANRDTYVFGFRDVTGLSQDEVTGQQNKVQISAPLIEVSVGEELWVTLANIGLKLRPDLVDSHTLHWHGFRNAIPFYDGVPETSVSVPIGRQFTYVFRPQDAGTYMYHCHFEDVEHVTMGMTGIVFVRPEVDTADEAYDADRGVVKRCYDDTFDTDGNPTKAGTKLAKDDPKSSAFDREYSILLTEIDSRAHFNDAHILLTDWTDFRSNFWLMNGRGFPDTLEPNAPFDATGTAADNANHGKPARRDDNTLVPATRADGTEVERLQFQPYSSRIVCNGGERVLVRLVNLGFQQQSLTMPGLTMRTVGIDARPMPLSRQTLSDTVTIGPGESRDVIIEPTYTHGQLNRFPFYNRDVDRYRGRADSSNLWWGGQRTEVTVLDGSLPAQKFTNEWDPSALAADSSNYPGMA